MVAGRGWNPLPTRYEPRLRRAVERRVSGLRVTTPGRSRSLLPSGCSRLGIPSGFADVVGDKEGGEVDARIGGVGEVVLAIPRFHGAGAFQLTQVVVGL